MAPAARQSSSRVNCASDGGAAANPPPVPRAGCPAAATAAPTPGDPGAWPRAPRFRPNRSQARPSRATRPPAQPLQRRTPGTSPIRPPPPRPRTPPRRALRHPPVRLRPPRPPTQPTRLWSRCPTHPDPQPHHRRAPRPTWARRDFLEAADLFEVGEALADHAQGEVLVALGAEDEAEAGDVVLGELAVAGGRAVGLDQPGALEEADLGDGDVGELGLEDAQHLADAHRPAGAGRLGRLGGAGGVSSAAAWPGRHVARTGSRMTLPAASRSTAGEEHQLELADLELVAGDESSPSSTRSRFR